MKTTKTILMKTVCKLFVAFLLLFTGMAFTLKPVSDTSYCSTASNSGQVVITEKAVAGVDDPAWFFLAISGVWQEDKIAYSTFPIYYPGYEKCNNQKKEIFQREAKIAFNKLLKTEYYGIFPDGSTNISVIQYKGKLAYNGYFLTTREEAFTEINVWTAEEKTHGYRTTYFDKFTFACK